jgi:hypothetical protein
MKYKLESVERKKKERELLNSVNCHHLHMIKSTGNTNEIDNEIKA